MFTDVEQIWKDFEKVTLENKPDCHDEINFNSLCNQDNPCKHLKKFIGLLINMA